MPAEWVHPSPLGDCPTPLAYRSSLKVCGSQAYRHYTDTHGINLFRKQYQYRSLEKSLHHSSCADSSFCKWWIKPDQVQATSCTWQWSRHRWISADTQDHIFFEWCLISSTLENQPKKSGGGLRWCSYCRGALKTQRIHLQIDYSSSWSRFQILTHHVCPLQLCLGYITLMVLSPFMLGSEDCLYTWKP